MPKRTQNGRFWSTLYTCSPLRCILYIKIHAIVCDEVRALPGRRASVTEGRVCISHVSSRRVLSCFVCQLVYKARTWLIAGGRAVTSSDWWWCDCANWADDEWRWSIVAVLARAVAAVRVRRRVRRQLAAAGRRRQMTILLLLLLTGRLTTMLVLDEHHDTRSPQSIRRRRRRRPESIITAASAATTIVHRLRRRPRLMHDITRQEINKHEAGHRRPSRRQLTR